MKTRGIAVALALGALVVGTWWSFDRDPSSALASVFGGAARHGGSDTRPRYRAPGKWPEAQAAAGTTRVKGRIRGKGGAPLIDARVCAFCADCDTQLNGHEAVCVRPDANGHYEFGALPAGSYHISATAKGRRPRLTNRGKALALSGGEQAEQDAELEEGGGEISGVVLDASGGPVAGALVQANFLSEELPYGRWYTAGTESDASGAFSLMAEQGLVMLVARAEGYAPARVQTAAPARGVRLALAPTSRISGTVVTRDEQSPVAGVQVTARGQRWQQIATSDGSGAFAIEGLSPGIYTLHASGDGWIGQYPGTVTVDISEAAQNVLLPVGRAARVVGAIVVGGAPCESGEAYLAPAAGQSLPSLVVRAGLAGEVVFEGVPMGTYRSAARCDRYGDAVEGPPVEVGYHDVTGLVWAIPGGLDVTLRLQTPGGEPAPLAWVQLTPEEGDALSGSSHERSDASGVVRFYGVTEGAYQVTTQVTEEPARIDVRAANAPNEFAITVSVPGAIEVTVVDAQGEPHDTVAVSALPQDRGPQGGVGEHISAGTYRIGPLPTGDYWVQIRDGVNPMAELGEGPGLVHVQANSVAKVTARYGGGTGMISGRVIDSSGNPLANIWVSALASSASSDPFGKMLDFQTQSQARRSLTGADGAFSIGELDEAATFTVTASYSLGGSASIDGARVGQAVELALPALCKLSGRVLNGEGEPAQYFRVNVRNASGSQQLSPEFGPEAQGAWSIDRVAPGSVEIEVFSPEGGASVQHALAPGQQLADVVLTLAPLVAALP